MRRRVDKTLITRESTVGHWRFRGNLEDSSPHGNHLTGGLGARASYGFRTGISEDGQTAMRLDGLDSGMIAPFLHIDAADAADFDFGTDSFSIEVLAAVEEAGTESLVRKWDGSIGFWFGVEGGQLALLLGNSPTAVHRVAEGAPVNDRRYHYLCVTVDRVNDEARFYVDGVADSGNPFDIATITGSISRPATPLVVGWNIEAVLDEVCVSKELLTPDAIAERATDRLVEASEYESGFLTQFLPAINHDNPALEQLLTPFTTICRDMMRECGQVADLVKYDRCPSRYLNLLASELGFELLNPPYLSDAERRHFLRWITWICQRKGRVVAIEKICELLGFDCTITEVAADHVPHVVNFHRTWDRDRYALNELSDTFDGNLQAYMRLLSTGHWQNYDGRVRGEGDGTADMLNGIVRDDAKSVFYMEADYEVLSGAADGAMWGFFLKHQDADNLMRYNIVLSSGEASLILIGVQTSTGPFLVPLGSVSDVLSTSEYLTGTHKLWLHADFGRNRFTGGIDSRTIFHEVAGPTSTITVGQKGLGVYLNLEVEFDNLKIIQIDRSLAPAVFDPLLSHPKLQIALTGTPPYAANRVAYLAQILPNYVPVGVDIEFV